MTVETAADRAAFFSTDEHGTAGTYTPAAGGGPFAVTVVFDNPDTRLDLGVAGVRAVAARALINRDELAADPAVGDTLAITGGASWSVRRAEADPTRTIFTLDLDPE